MPNREWEKVKDIVFAALSQPSDSWPEFLDRECGKDSSLRSEVEVLLNSYESGFLEASVLETSLEAGRPLGPVLEPGSSFSHYQIVSLLGRGGMGEVYLATDTSLNRSVAIKMIHSESGLGHQAAARLLREARAAAKLEHPGICSVYEVGEANGVPFISMQYIDGASLQEWMAGRAVDPATAIAFARQIAEALDKAHELGVIHRDVKPANVMVDGDGSLKVLDFGLAKETTHERDGLGLSVAGLIAGTIGYMSPEHLRGQAVNSQTDIWSLGVVLHQMLTGRLPFSGDTKADLIASILNDRLEPVRGLRTTREQAINHLLHRALERDQSARYQTMEELCQDLRALEAGGVLTGVAGKRRLGMESVPIWARRFALGSVALAFVVAIATYFLWPKPAAQAHAFSNPDAKPLRITTAYSAKRKAAAVVTDLSFSPDGTRLVFGVTEAKKSSVQVLQLSDGQITTSSDATLLSYSPVWSPDGERIAFVVYADGINRVWTIPVSGGVPEQLFAFDNSYRLPKLRKWSNDAKKLFFENGGRLQTIDIGTGRILDVDINGISGKPVDRFSISRDDSALLVVTVENEKHQLWHKSIAENDARVVSDGSSMNGPPEFFPDGRTFAYSADDGDSFQIYIGKTEEPKPQQLTFSDFSATGPVVSPDGTQIAYVSNTDQANIYRTDLITGVQETVTDSTHLQLFPAFAPDGKSIAFQTINDSAKFTTGQLKVEPSRNGEPGVTAELPGRGCCVRWDSGGNRLTFVRGTPGNFNVWTYDVALGAEKQITRSGFGLPNLGVAPFELHRSPFEMTRDGSRLAFVKKTSNRDEIRLVNRNAESEGETVIPIEEAGARVGGLKWSTDGSQLAYSETLPAEPASGSRKTRLMLMRGTEMVKLTEFQALSHILGWSDVDDAVFALVEAEGELKVISIPIASGEVERHVATLKNAKPFGVELSPDRRYISYTVNRNAVDNVCVTELSTVREKCLTSNDDAGFYYSGVTWAPDSKSLLYSRQTGGIQIALISQRNEENR